ncbi:MAG: peptide deformylase [Desulfovibrio sp.]|jgi:peptide deformylase|nr:peptide deformylase [Desulfovibrio sp.]
MIRPVLQYPDPRLTRRAEPVSAVTPELKELIFDMAETMYARDGIGLAAPQVGEAIRLVVMDVSGPEKRADLRVLVNPILTLRGRDVDSEEGCLSVQDYRSTVCRKEFVHVEAADPDGRPLSFDAEGLLAMCLQHECDHLDGTLFIDRISRLKRAMLDKKVQKKEKR